MTNYLEFLNPNRIWEFRNTWSITICKYKW